MPGCSNETIRKMNEHVADFTDELGARAHTHTQTETDRQTDRQTDRDRHTETDRQRERTSIYALFEHRNRNQCSLLFLMTLMFSVKMLSSL